MLIKYNVLALDSQELFQCVQVGKHLMFQIVTEGIAAHHLLGLFVEVAVDKN